MQALLGRERPPFLKQLVALCRWQLLKVLERGVQLLALLWRHGAKLAPVCTCLLALFGRHLLPMGDVLADRGAALRGQRGPVLGTLEHVPLAARG